MAVRIIQGDVRERTVPLKDYLLCRKCARGWRRVSSHQSQNCPYCTAGVDARNRKGHTKNPNRLSQLLKWRRDNPEAVLILAKRGRDTYRKAALLAIGGGSIMCAGCGCDSYDYLEINHKNGGGAAEFRKSGHAFYRLIATGRRQTEDLEILCKVCNARHALELKYGRLPFKIIWGEK